MVLCKLALGKFMKTFGCYVCCVLIEVVYKYNKCIEGHFPIKFGRLFWTMGCKINVAICLYNFRLKSGTSLFFLFYPFFLLLILYFISYELNFMLLGFSR
jgi:hypothetical protein